MATCQIIVQLENGDVLKRAWVYWKAGGNVTLLRSNNDGRLQSLAGTKSKQPRDYTQKFTTTIGSTVDVYYSRGALPIPGPRLDEHSDCFFHRTITATPPTSLPTANVSPNTPPNTLVGVVTATIILSPILLTLVTPAEIRLWPILWELPSDCDLDPACQSLHPAARTPDYHTAALAQGSNVRWPTPGATTPTLPVTEQTQTPAPPDAVMFNHAAVQIRPREKAAHFEGSIDARASGVTVQMLDVNGTVIPLRQTIDLASARVQQVSGSLLAAASGKQYKADLFFVNAVDSFGIVQLFVHSVGMTPPIVEAFTGYLCGFQITLIDDGAGSSARAPSPGTQPGPLEMDEQHEKLVVDFINSPQTTRPLVRDETRLRRMCVFELRNRERPLDLSPSAPAPNPNVLRPEMPLWMAEFQAVGVSFDAFTTLMNLRGYYDAKVFDLVLTLDWALSLNWDGPDLMRDPHAFYQYNLRFQQNQVARLHFGTAGQLVDASGADVTLNAGVLDNAFDAPPHVMPFPVAGRRLPQVVITGRQRPWGRKNGAISKDTLVIESQLHVSKQQGGAETELIRGGDGSLSANLQIDAINVLSLADPAPALRLPQFHINGLNPIPTDLSVADLETNIINAIVEQYFNRHSTARPVQMLTLPIWQITAREIFHHESQGYLQFQNDHSKIVRLSGNPDLYYGQEFKMPYFGGPHGYAMVQVDYGANPSPSEVSSAEELLNQIWDFIEGLRGGVKHLMGAKASQAYNRLGLPGNQLTDTRRTQAVFQREVVRAYNGFGEFQWNGSDFEIQPTLKKWLNPAQHHKGAYKNLLYPNNVFQRSGSGAHITYFTGDGVPNHILSADTIPGFTDADANTRQLFNWPIQFRAADYGPGI